MDIFRNMICGMFMGWTRFISRKSNTITCVKRDSTSTFLLDFDWLAYKTLVE